MMWFSDDNSNAAMNVYVARDASSNNDIINLNNIRDFPTPYYLMQNIYTIVHPHQMIDWFQSTNSHCFHHRSSFITYGFWFQEAAMSMRVAYCSGRGNYYTHSILYAHKENRWGDGIIIVLLAAGLYKKVLLIAWMYIKTKINTL